MTEFKMNWEQRFRAVEIEQERRYIRGLEELHAEEERSKLEKDHNYSKETLPNSVSFKYHKNEKKR